ncbi:fumarylacetoacetate hydrolase family protein [Erythrobacteraceae bacterium WH01K]|nr:fumarylacetoacetate hydrolase family protein [Erythrobacteraceae bacterium WH01K]
MGAEVQDIADAFVEARRTGKAITQYPGPRPTDLASAYAIQDAALSVWDRKVGGWKVGKINPPADGQLGANRLVGPAFTDGIFEEGDRAACYTVFRGGFAAAEAEFMLRLAPRNGSLPANREEAMEWVDEIRIGIEIASSPYANINADGPCVTVSDHGNNAGLLLGKRIPREAWGTLDDVQVSLEIEGEVAGRATTATMLDGPFGAVAFLLDNLARRNIALEAGWWISSGAITGVHAVEVGDEVVARFEGIGDVSLRVE